MEINETNAHIGQQAQMADGFHLDESGYEGGGGQYAASSNFSGGEHAVQELLKRRCPKRVKFFLSS
ncbi:hypothetical protein [Paenibacillus sp. SI8]|uniref:hypothetical protein n=1 Tax=unclassified Paenibacillus TaxID=185978 RepID=UPI0034651355